MRSDQLRPGRLLRRVLVRSVLAFGALALGSGLVQPGATPVQMELRKPEATQVVPDSPAARIQRLEDRHHCWTGAAPEPDVIPGHAVVTLPGHRPQLVDADVGFGIWLDGDPGTLHAFCR